MARKMRPLWAFCLAALVLGSGAACGPAGAINGGAAGAPDENAGTLIDPPKELADFTLTTHTGATLRMSDLRGRPALVFFGYTQCPDVCPLTLADWKKVKQSLGDAATDVAFLFVSVDPKRDTPPVLAKFVGRYDPAFVGATADEQTLSAMAKEYGVFFQDQPHEAGQNAYDVDHSSASFLLDQDGRLHMVYSYGVPADTISADVTRLRAR